MSKLNGDRARFHKDRKRKLLRRARTRLVMASLPARQSKDATSAASLRMHDEGARSDMASDRPNAGAVMTIGKVERGRK